MEKENRSKENIWRKINQYNYFAQASPMLSIHALFADTSKSNLRFSFQTTTLSLGLVKSKSSFPHDPLLRIGQLQILRSSLPSP